MWTHKDIAVNQSNKTPGHAILEGLLNPLGKSQLIRTDDKHMFTMLCFPNSKVLAIAVWRTVIQHNKSKGDIRESEEVIHCHSGKRARIIGEQDDG
jgi:hypothetical protein